MPTTTNLGIVTPSSNDYVTNGATAMTTMADDIDGYWGALTSYTPTLTNVTGGTVAGHQVKMGKLGFLWVYITAGTATATGTISASLPSGWTAATGSAQVLPAVLSDNLITVTVGTAGTTMVIRKTSTGTNFTLGDSVAGIRINGWLYLA